MAAYEIDVIRKGVAVLRALRRADGEAGVTDLSRAVGLGKATTFRILYTLTLEGLVKQDPETKRYRLGPELIALGRAATDAYDLRREAKPIMEHLTAETGLPSYLNVAGASEVVCLDHRASLANIDLYGQAGRTLPYHACPSGLVLLAFGPPERVEQVIGRGLQRYASGTIVDADQLRAELERVRRIGYAAAVADLEESVSSISAPIRDHRGEVTAALGLAGFTAMLDIADDLVSRVLRAADAISAQQRSAMAGAVA